MEYRIKDTGHTILVFRSSVKGYTNHGIQDIGFNKERIKHRRYINGTGYIIPWSAYISIHTRLQVK